MYSALLSCQVILLRLVYPESRHFVFMVILSGHSDILVDETCSVVSKCWMLHVRDSLFSTCTIRDE